MSTAVCVCVFVCLAVFLFLKSNLNSVELKDVALTVHNSVWD